MRRLILLAALAAACKPDLGTPPSLVTDARFLAIQADPAEAKPGADVTLHALAADPAGELMPADLTWAVCSKPKPIAENNVVADDCLFTADGSLTQHGPDVTMTVPAMACALFGPQTPPVAPGEDPLRPRDPDATGGYYQPVRGLFKNPAGDDYVAAVALVRISCDLASAPIDIAQDFRMRYTPNVNPTLSGMTYPDTVGPGEVVTLTASWTADSAETYPVFDLQSRALVDHREALRVSWYATAGDFDHDRTGAGETDMVLTTSNTWTAPDTAGPVHLWAVLRDSRGGVAYTAFDIAVAAASSRSSSR